MNNDVLLERFIVGPIATRKGAILGARQLENLLGQPFGQEVKLDKDWVEKRTANDHK